MASGCTLNDLSRNPDIFVYPFADLPSCAYEDEFSESFRGLVRHVDLFHRGENIAPYKNNKRTDMVPARPHAQGYAVNCPLPTNKQINTQRQNGARP